MKTFVVVLLAHRRRGDGQTYVIHPVFIQAYDAVEAAADGLELCKKFFSEKTHGNHQVVVRDTQSMYDELKFVR